MKVNSWYSLQTFLSEISIGDEFTKMDIYQKYDNFEKNFIDTITVYINNLIRIGSLNKVEKNKFKLEKRLSKDVTWSKLRQAEKTKMDIKLFD